MEEHVESGNRKIAWRLPVVAAVVGLGLAVYAVNRDPTVGAFAVLFVVGPATFFVLLGILLTRLVQKQWRQAVVVTVIAASTVGLQWGVFEYELQIREHFQWWMHANSLKAKVLAQPAEHGLHYMEWGSWGFAGSDTQNYLVYSPDDEIRNYSRQHRAGLPCSVSQVRRLESHWYSVTFYVDGVWPDGEDASEGCS